MGKIAAGGLVCALAVLLAYDRFSFASNSHQRSMLATYLPEAACDKADFELLERDEGGQDWGYVVAISGSPQCIQSIRNAMVRRGSAANDPNSAVHGLVLPGHTDSENELVAFDFESQPGAIIWTRSKT